MTTHTLIKTGETDHDGRIIYRCTNCSFMSWAAPSFINKLSEEEALLLMHNMINEKIKTCELWTIYDVLR
jgi:hypothetical protein